ncbi:aspartyl-phosphate phosphatase Spo0E family protein [Paenibacillus sp. MBLB4367]|uniref:aspartyl-phosphate phosphatase Spo0E family protein n=1 Tax=Paenibacillus sp. MBLB4367 TaxID=3384767 RepID=UPI0039080188
MKKIERLRSELNQLTQQRSLLDPLVIKKSQQLDKLIAHYMKRILRRKASSK